MRHAWRAPADMDADICGGDRLYGMEQDLGLGPNQYQIAVSILFVTYVVRRYPKYDTHDVVPVGVFG